MPLPSTSSAPLVSACVPTYNGARYLRTCLESLLAQELQDLEILIADDASADDTLDIAREYRDPRVRILDFADRAGMAGNWNRCLAQARGRYLCLVAQDDYVLPHWADRLAQLLESHPEAALAFGRRNLELADEPTRSVVGEFFETKYPAMLQSFYDRIDTVVPSATMISAALEYHFKINLIGEPTFTMVRRDHPVAGVGYHSEMTQMLDWEFAMRFFAQGPILYCPEVLGTYRIHAAGQTIDNRHLSRHHREFAHMLDSVLDHVPGLSLAQRSILEGRRQELEHTLTIDAERRELLAHVETLESDRRHLHGHVRNLEKIIRKTHADRVFRTLCRVKDAFVRPS